MGKIGIFEIMIFFLLPVIITLIAYSELFKKAGKPGWAVIVPIYNILVLLEIIKKPWWWLVLLLIPGINIIFSIWALNLIVKSFGKDEGYTVLCILLPFIFIPVLAFSKSTRYIYAKNDEVDSIGIA